MTASQGTIDSPSTYAQALHLARAKLKPTSQIPEVRAAQRIRAFNFENTPEFAYMMNDAYDRVEAQKKGPLEEPCVAKFKQTTLDTLLGLNERSVQGFIQPSEQNTTVGLQRVLGYMDISNPVSAWDFTPSRLYIESVLNNFKAALANRNVRILEAGQDIPSGAAVVRIADGNDFNAAMNEYGRSRFKPVIPIDILNSRLERDSIFYITKEIPQSPFSIQPIDKHTDHYSVLEKLIQPEHYLRTPIHENVEGVPYRFGAFQPFKRSRN